MASKDRLEKEIHEETVRAKMCSWYWQDKAGANGTGLRIFGFIVAMSAAIGSADLVTNEAVKGSHAA